MRCIDLSRFSLDADRRAARPRKSPDPFLSEESRKGAGLLCPDLERVGAF